MDRTLGNLYSLRRTVGEFIGSSLKASIGTQLVTNNTGFHPTLHTEHEQVNTANVPQQQLYLLKENCYDMTCSQMQSQHEGKVRKWARVDYLYPACYNLILWPIGDNDIDIEAADDSFPLL